VFVSEKGVCFCKKEGDFSTRFLPIKIKGNGNDNKTENETKNETENENETENKKQNKNKKNK
jgi:hypothetical protein